MSEPNVIEDPEAIRVIAHYREAARDYRAQIAGLECGVAKLADALLCAQLEIAGLRELEDEGN